LIAAAAATGRPWPEGRLAGRQSPITGQLRTGSQIRRGSVARKPPPPTAAGVIDHEGGSALKQLLLLASLALTGLLATTVPALAAAAPAVAATPAANFGYYDNQPIEYEATV
jgi:hypothetical protein